MTATPPAQSTVRNADVARTLETLAAAYEVQGDARRANAYERAATTVRGLGHALRPDVPARELEALPNIGPSIARKIKEKLETGHVKRLDELQEALPRDFVKFTRVNGVGPRTAERFKTELGVDTVQDLLAAAQDGRVTARFGARIAQRVIAAAPLLESEEKPRWLLYRALPLADRIASRLRALPQVERAAFAGSARRGKPTVGDLDFVATVREAADEAVVADAFAEMPEVADVYQRGTSTLVRLATGIDADLTIVPDDAWGTALMYFTGSREHTLQLRTRAKKRGLTLNARGLYRVAPSGEPGERVAGATEASVYDALGFAQTPPPELRENHGELEAADAGTLPDLLTVADVKGDCHVHSDGSDGSASLAEMVQAAADAGREWVAITDHTQSLHIARGKPPEFFEERLAHVAAREWPIPVLVGAECDILPDGSLDLPDRVLEELDVVVGSVHAELRMDEARMTRRVLDAVETGLVDVLGHPTGRRMPRRPESALDFDRVVDACVARDVALEVDGGPERLDLDGALAQRARERGARFSVDSDAHTTRELSTSMGLGVVTARRGWLTRADVVNAMPVEAFRDWVRARRKR